jgi:hypothetical protein
MRGLLPTFPPYFPLLFAEFVVQCRALHDAANLIVVEEADELLAVNMERLVRMTRAVTLFAATAVPDGCVRLADVAGVLSFVAGVVSHAALNADDVACTLEVRDDAYDAVVAALRSDADAHTQYVPPLYGVCDRPLCVRCFTTARDVTHRSRRAWTLVERVQMGIQLASDVWEEGKDEVDTRHGGGDGDGSDDGGRHVHFAAS